MTMKQLIARVGALEKQLADLQSTLALLTAALRKAVEHANG